MLREPTPHRTSRITRVEESHREPPPFTGWRCALELDENRVQRTGSESELTSAIRCGADLRVGTGFRHHEHIDLNSSCRELIHEFIDLRVTYLLDDRWTAGVCNLRMPVRLPDGFGPRESLSFFLYNQNGLQAIARPFLDGKPVAEQMVANADEFARMTRFRELDRSDTDTNSPSCNFIYDFDFFRFCVNRRWREVLSHDSDGTVLQGSVDELAAAFSNGSELKVAIRGLCEDLADETYRALDHEVFVHVGSCYYYTQRKLMIGATHPVVRIAPAIPLVYRSRGWDFGWLLPRTDGHMARWLCDPYTLKFQMSSSRHAMRWFAGI